MKKVKRLIGILGVLLLLPTYSLVGCAKKVNNGDNYLEIYCLDVGYGVQWVKDMASDFGTLDWVKEKYPDYDYKVVTNDRWEFLGAKIVEGPAVNTADAMFGISLRYLTEKKWNDEYLLADLEEVYESKVDGDVTFAQKLDPNYLQSNLDVATNSYRFVSWAGGIDSYLYNATLFNKLGLEVPLTTNQLIGLAQTVKGFGGNKAGYSEAFTFTNSTNTGYYKYAFPIWWSQYEGVDEYTNYFRGISENMYSNDIFKQQGRLESLNVLDELLNGDNGYFDKNCNIYEFMEAQTNFIMGKGLMYFCGDWFDYEMNIIAKGLQANGYTDEIRMMRMPVISAIVDKTPSIKAEATRQGKTNDEVLAQVIAKIDNGETSMANITATDFETIYQARSIMHSIGATHHGVVPQYSSAKELALDFMKYIATDRANLIYSKATNGSSLPFMLDMQSYAPDYYQTISPMQKDRISIMNSSTVSATVLPDELNYPLVYFGGMTMIQSLNGSTIEAYLNKSGANRNTGLDLYNKDIEYWNTTRWNNLLATIGQ